MRTSKDDGILKRADILEYIISYICSHGYSPRYEEIGYAVGLRSKSSVHRQLYRLREEGKIDFIEHEPRTITVPGYSFVRVPDTTMR